MKRFGIRAAWPPTTTPRPTPPRSAGDRPAGLAQHRAYADRARRRAVPHAERLTYDGVFDRINHFLGQETTEANWTVVSDAAFSLIGSMNLACPRAASCRRSAGCPSAGRSARPPAPRWPPSATDARPMVFVGDGSFQETCQEISTHTRLGLRSVVFVLDNGHFYGIEQMLVHPCLLRRDRTPDEAGLLQRPAPVALRPPRGGLLRQEDPGERAQHRAPLRAGRSAGPPRRPAPTRSTPDRCWSASACTGTTTRGQWRTRCNEKGLGPCPSSST